MKLKSLKSIFVIALVLLVSTGCFSRVEDEELTLKQVPEAENYAFITDNFESPHKEPGSYTGTRRLRSIIFQELEDGMERIAFGVISEDETLEEFPSFSIEYDQDNMVMYLDIYAGSVEFPVTWQLDNSELIESHSVENRNIPGQFGQVHIYRRMELQFGEAIEYRIFWSETHNRMILDLKPLN